MQFPQKDTFCFCTRSCLLFVFKDDLIKVHKFKPTIKWRQSFENYLKTMPPYYIGVNSRQPFGLARFCTAERNETL